MAGQVQAAAEAVAQAEDADDTGWRALAAVPLLARFPEQRLRDLWARALPRHYAAGDVLRRAGEPASRLLLLLRGRVAASGTTQAGRAVRYGEWLAPCALEKVALLDGRGHAATLTALEPCTVRTLPRQAFLALLEDAAEARAHVLGVLAAQVRQQHESAEARALPAEARLAGWLLDGLGAVPARAPARVPLLGGRAALARTLGVGRLTVGRALSKLRRRGLVLVHRREIEVLAPDLLALRPAPEKL